MRKMNPTRHMDIGREYSQLFLVRLWAEVGNVRSNSEGSEGSGEQIEWCGKLQDVVSGEAYYFRGWRALVDRLLEMSVADGLEASDVGASPTEVLP